jgi:hypothetical protein
MADVLRPRMDGERHGAVLDERDEDGLDAMEM